ncbi:DUF3667 domain-containing protein [Brevundimonas sp. NPDC003935]|uniref:DUF3667 domain-containing protein n=1 Tax=unclassified Brevundimonas TaxID=2622653 RepID=UPI00289EB3D1|nr:DUF3667 domain-containing protein [Brevundimonas sp.]
MIDLEAAGGAMTGGIIAGAIEKPTGKAGEHHTSCADCGAEVSGNFCSNCGQAAHVHRTLLHLGEELLHGVMHFDGRFWRTLPLLILNPGRLTREWVQGRRTRYVSPLAMFLFTLFVMFFALSFMPHSEVKLQGLPEQIAAQREAIAEAEVVVAAAQKEVDEATAAMEPADGSPPAPNSGARAGVAAGVLAAAQAGVISEKAKLERLEHDAVEGRKDGLTPGSWQAQVADLAADVGQDGEVNGLTKTVAKKLKNPDLALYKLQQTVYKFAFLLVPLSIPFVALMFLWKRGFTLYDHGVFVLYSLTFMSLLLMAVVVLATTIKGAGPAVGLVASLIVPVHMFAQLKGAYSLKIFSTLWRTIALLIFCEIAATLFIVSIIYLGLGH